MLLSIGMIVKNEEKYLRGCLTSMSPILQQLESELIIFDTGSTDATIEIAKEFTDKVYQIKWRDDFAWARNHTIDRARGKWYMYVDADEWFTDVTDLLNFFISGEHKNYNCASFRLRNIITDTAFNYIRPIRLFKMKKGLRFTGTIHEYIKPTPVMKELESTIDHYGYYGKETEDKEILAQKHERNIKPLLSLYEKNPQDLQVIYQITQEFLQPATSADKAKKYIDEGLKLVNGNQDNIFYHGFYHALVTYYAKKEEFENLINTIREYTRGLHAVNRSVIQLLAMETRSLVTLGRYKEAATAAQQTLKYFDENQKGLLDNNTDMIIRMHAELLENRLLHIETLINCLAYAGDFISANKWVKTYEKETGQKCKADIYEIFARKCVEEKRWNDMPLLYPHDIAKCNDLNDEEKIEMHEAIVRTGHKYRTMIYNKDLYCENAVISLPTTEAYIFCAGEAYACKDSGDILGFVQGLRKAVNIDPYMKDIVWLCVEKIQNHL